MNAERRARLQQAIDILTEVKDEEDGALNNLPDSFRDGTQGEKMQEYIDDLDTAIDSIQSIVEAQ